MKQYSRINKETNRIEIRMNTKPSKDILSLISEHGFKWAKSKEHWYVSFSELIDQSNKKYSSFSDAPVTKDQLSKVVDLYTYLNNLVPEIDFISKKYVKALDHFKNDDKKLTFRFVDPVPDLGSKKKYFKTQPKRVKSKVKPSETRSNDIVINLEKKPTKQLQSKLEREGFIFLSKTKATKKYNPSLSGIDVFSNEIEDPYSMDGVAGKNVYDLINKMLLDTINSDKELVWRKPWKSINNYGLAATNFVSKNPYRGANSFLLNFIAPFLRGKEWDNPYFLTFKQVNSLGGKIKKGSEGYFVTYFNMLYKLGDKKISEQEYWSRFVQCAEKDLDFCSDLKAIPILKYYKVFNGDDIEGIDWKLKPKIEPSITKKIESAEQIWANYPPVKPKLVFKDPEQAFYSPSRDVVNMPIIDAFHLEQQFYGTLFHELIHSTGSKKRLNRKLGSKFGSKDYSYEELIAELGSSYLCGETGILFHTLNNSAAYIEGWKNRLKKFVKSDEKFFFSAASKAQEAADYILQTDKSGTPKYRSLTKKSNLVAAPLGRIFNEDKVRKSNHSDVDVEEEEEIITVKDSISTKRPPAKKSSRLYSGDDISNMTFDVLNFRGQWGELLNNPPRNFKLMVSGLAKNGKTAFNLQFADYLSQFGDVLYNLAEQGITESTRRLINDDLRISKNPHIIYSKTKTLSELDEDIENSGAQFIFVDLISYYREIKRPEDWKAFQDKHDDKSFILVFESTKGGQFKGDNAWFHLLEGLIMVHQFVATSQTRYGSGKFIVWPEKVAQLEAANQS